MRGPGGAEAVVVDERGGRPRARTLLSRGRPRQRRLTRRRLDAFCAAYATEAAALVVHSHDLDHRRHFPNAVHVSPRADRAGDVRADPPYAEALRRQPDASRALIVCTGLLEHVPDPAALVAELARLLEPGGRLVLSGSGVFSFHGAPDSYFHFAPGGLRRLLGPPFEVEELRGSTRPFETLAVLAQRIDLQCDLAPPVRLLVRGMARALPVLDAFVRREYDNLARVEPADRAVGMMPATLMAVARKRAEA